MSKIPKAARKAIESIIQKIPKSYYIINASVLKEMKDHRAKEIKNRMFTGNFETGVIDVSGNDEIIIIKDQRLAPINHRRRLYDAYKKAGIQGCRAYLRWVDKNNIMLNKVYGLKIELDVAKELIYHQISEIL